jgi:hypothetical protein
MTRTETIEAIVIAARRPELEIAAIVQHECADGQYRSALGMPFGMRTTGKTAIVGYAFRMPSGVTVGTRYKTREEAETAQAARRAAADAEFRQHLTEATDAEIEQKAAYWLKNRVGGV